MTDTNTLAPADAEILDAAEDFRSQYTHGGTTFDEFDEIGFARAVLAKWGAPAPASQPVAGPAAWAATSEEGNVEALGMNQSRRFDTPLYAAPQPAAQAQEDAKGAERWEFRWLNPANNLHVAPSDLGWKTVNSKGMRSEKEVLEDLQAYRYQGKPVYEVRPLFATRALEKPEIRCPVRLANGGDCPRHNLQCGWPDCNKESK